MTIDQVVKDPVCGMQVDPATTTHHARHGGRDYHFCSARCRERFLAAPESFLADTVAPAIAAAPVIAAAPAPTGSIYTCPMHPEIRQDHPGTCPICGMALEPLLPTEEDANPELEDFSRRFWWTLPLSVIVLALAMFGHRSRSTSRRVPGWSWR
jgi:Cu+-exporting ATPase